MEGKVSFGDFAKLELRVGEIKKVEAHPNADKLFVLAVDLGEESERTIVAGLKGFYSEDELVGRKAIFAANLEPAVLRGVESNGMILAAVSEDKKEVKILSVDDGAEVGMRVS
ncbi:MAG: methionine--tRNA ligase subunit beta [Nanoarchaeota archaeon]|nr:methionine--tRNA ligase subunit beta [Nanoarchaeota archaeon]